MVRNAAGVAGRGSRGGAPAGVMGRPAASAGDLDPKSPFRLLPIAYIGEPIGRLPPGLIRATYGDAAPRLPDLRGDVTGATCAQSR